MSTRPRNRDVGGRPNYRGFLDAPADWMAAARAKPHRCSSASSPRSRTMECMCCVKCRRQEVCSGSCSEIDRGWRADSSTARLREAPTPGCRGSETSTKSVPLAPSIKWVSPCQFACRISNSVIGRANERLSRRRFRSMERGGWRARSGKRPARARPVQPSRFGQG